MAIPSLSQTCRITLCEGLNHGLRSSQSARRPAPRQDFVTRDSLSGSSATRRHRSLGHYLLRRGCSLAQDLDLLLEIMDLLVSPGQRLRLDCSWRDLLQTTRNQVRPWTSSRTSLPGPQSIVLNRRGRSRRGTGIRSESLGLRFSQSGCGTRNRAAYLESWFLIPQGPGAARRGSN